MSGSDLPKVVEKWKYASILNKICAITFLLFTFCFYVNHWVFFTFSPPDNVFDGALRDISHLYYAMDLLPYRDFGFVYPPGLLWIYKFQTIENKNLCFGIILLIFHLFIITLFLSNAIKNPNKMWATGALVILLDMSLISTISGEPFSIPILFVLMTLVIGNLMNTFTKIHLIGILTSILAISLFLIRWDRILLFVFAQIGILIICKIFLDKDATEKLRKYSLILLYQVIGSIIGFSILLIWSVKNSVLLEMIDFVFNIPTHVILPYRQLPLPKLLDGWYSDAYMLYGTCCVLSLCFLRNIYLYMKNNISITNAIGSFFAILLPFCLLPYAIGRADIWHFMPFYMLSLLSVLLQITSTGLSLWIGSLYFILLLFSSNLTAIFLTLKPFHINKNLYHRNLQNILKDCTNIVSTNSISAKSMFVGRISYNKFILNIAELYLLNPTIPPASSFISDEPGLQNSCKYGKKIGAQLIHAPKPMLAFLEQGEQGPEPNLTSTMTSCGKIENVLKTLPFKEIGNCSIAGKTFSVREYYANKK